MGFLSKVWKGVKKVVKKVGKGLKKVIGKVGKAFGELGIVGQIGLMFAMPAIGSWLSGLGASWAASGNALAQFAGKAIEYGVNFVSKVGNSFSTVTEGIGNFFGEFASSVAKKVGFSGGIPGFESATFGDTFANLGKSFSSAGTSLSNAVTGTAQATIETVAQDQLLASAAENTVQDQLNKATAEATGDFMSSSVSEAVADKAAPSLLDKATDFVVSETKDAVKTGIESSVVSGIRQATGVEQEPVYNTYYSHVADAPLDMSIGQSNYEQFDNSRYMQQNQQDLMSRAYGNNAVQMFQNNVWKQYMNRAGVAV